MMTIKQIEVTVGEITQGYINNEEQVLNDEYEVKNYEP